MLVVIILMLTACQSESNSPSSILSDNKPNEEEMNEMNQQLITSAEQGDLENVLQLLQEGAQINATDHNGRTAAVAATHNNQVEVVKALIENGADINIRDNRSDNVLLYAGATGYPEIVALAVEAGASTTLTNRFGGTALIPAAERGHIEVIQYLLEKSDVDVNHINNLHWTALIEAIILSNGGETHQKIVQMLLDHGADPNIADGDGVTPLQHAQQKGYKEIEQILLEFGAK